MRTRIQQRKTPQIPSKRQKEDPKPDVIDPLPTQISKWDFSKDHIQTVVAHYQKAKIDKDNTLKLACEDYFKRAITTQGEHIIDFYDEVKTQPELLELFFDKLIRSENDNHASPVLKKNLQAIINTSPKS